jgi:hypothetical protein
MRAATDASKIQMNPQAKPARMAIPQLYARRSPTIANWRGTYPSMARIRARRGAPLKPVLAASTRMSVVTTWKHTKTTPSP